MGELQAAVLGVAFVVMLAAVTITDLCERVIPNRVLAVSALIAFAIVAAADTSGLLERIAAAAGAGGLLLVPALINPEAMGAGDVKLAAVMGLYLGPAIAPALLVAFVLGGAAGACIVVRHGIGARKRALPFAPFLAAGGIVGLVAGEGLLGWHAYSLVAQSFSL